MDHSVELVDGVGKKRAQALSQIGVFTVGELLEAKTLPFPPKTVSQLRQAATNYTKMHPQEQPIIDTQEYKEHSWQGKSLHIRRADGSLIRAITGPLRVESDRVIARMSWYEKGKVKFKGVSPISLAAFHILWSFDNVVSDDSDDDVPITQVAPTTEPNLPPLEVPGANQPSLLFTIKEVNLLLTS